MAHLSVQMETHVVSYLQVNGVVVLSHKLFAAAMEYIAVQMDTPAMCQLELAVKRAKV